MFGYRAAFRCTSIGSSNIILGDGLSEAGFCATDISPTNPGEGFLIAEGGSPQRIKVAYLTDADIIALADYAAWTRRTAAPPHRRPGHRRRLTATPERNPSLMSLTTDTAARQAFITGLRDLADYLDQHPAVPVPHPRHRHPPERQQRRRRRMRPGRPLRPPARRPPSRTNWLTAATTGPSVPSARSATGSIAISDHAMARHYAHESYHGSVTRRPTPGPDA